MSKRMESNRPVTVVIIGAGGRGYLSYAPFAKKYPNQMQIVGVAEPDEKRRRTLQDEYVLSANRCFSSAEELFSISQFADMAFICTQDDQHVKHGLLAMEAGYDILLEKPISSSVVQCRELSYRAKELKRSVTVCHVLRYAPFYQKIRNLIEIGEIGEVVCIQAAENVSYWHQAHSYVRGKWRNSCETSPMILAKCCHDMDILVWLAGSACKTISSVGGLRFFRKENMPEGAPEYCLEGCPEKEACPFDAEKIYITNKPTGYDANGCGWMQRDIGCGKDRESLYRALRESPYGRCVFQCDNNVVDHQTLSAVMKNGVSISFSMCGLNNHNYRTIHIMGTKGDLWGELEREKIFLSRFGEKTQEIRLDAEDMDSGHGGGDFHMLSEMIRARKEGKNSLTSLEESLASHFMALAAEKSRQMGGECVDVDAFAAQKEKRNE
nr:Gfo/Idh/MocA family oxidoreductase [uncultured Acetatifactor sp.]